jgi:HAMP domain-containing protein/type II secretory pathway pseudopilin PulG
MKARTQLTVAATAVVGLLVAIIGQFLIWRTGQRDRDDIDHALAARAAQIQAEATKTGRLPTDGAYPVRLISGTQVRAQSGSTVQFSAPVTDGFSTVAAADGHDYRSWAETLKTGVQLQVLTDYSAAQGRHRQAVRLVDLSVLVAIVLGGLASWFATGIVLRPLRRLEEGARELSPDDLSGRLPSVKEPREVAEIAASVNALLDRMQAAADPARPFASPSGRATGGSASSGPAAGGPAAGGPAAGGPAAGGPAAGGPAAGGPAAGGPASGETTSDGPLLAETAGAEPGAAESAAAEPLSGPPDLPEPTRSTVTPPPADPDTFPPRPTPADAPPESGGAPLPRESAPLAPDGVPLAPGGAALAPGGAALAPGGAALAPGGVPLAPAAAPANGAEVAGARVFAATVERAAGDAELRAALEKLGDDLDTLLDNPELSTTQRHLILASIQNEYRRVVLLTQAE